MLPSASSRSLRAPGRGQRRPSAPGEAGPTPAGRGRAGTHASSGPDTARTARPPPGSSSRTSGASSRAAGDRGRAIPCRAARWPGRGVDRGPGLHPRVESVPRPNGLGTAWACRGGTVKSGRASWRPFPFASPHFPHIPKVEGSQRVHAQPPRCVRGGNSDFQRGGSHGGAAPPLCQNECRRGGPARGARPAPGRSPTPTAPPALRPRHRPAPLRGPAARGARADRRRRRGLTPAGRRGATPGRRG